MWLFICICLDKLLLVMIIQKNKNSNLKARLIIIQEQSWPSRLFLYPISHKCWFSGQNSQLTGQILFCPDVSTGGFQKLFRALCVRTCTCILKYNRKTCTCY